MAPNKLGRAWARMMSLTTVFPYDVMLEDSVCPRFHVAEQCHLVSTLPQHVPSTQTGQTEPNPVQPFSPSVSVGQPVSGSYVWARPILHALDLGFFRYNTKCGRGFFSIYSHVRLVSSLSREINSALSHFSSYWPLFTGLHVSDDENIARPIPGIMQFGHLISITN